MSTKFSVFLPPPLLSAFEVKLISVLTLWFPCRVPSHFKATNSFFKSRYGFFISVLWQILHVGFCVQLLSQHKGAINLCRFWFKIERRIIGLVSVKLNPNALNESSICYVSHKLKQFGIIILAFWLFALGYRPNFWILKIHPNNKPNVLMKKKTPES